MRRFRARVFLSFGWLLGVAGIWALVVSTVIREGGARPIATVLVIVLIAAGGHRFARRIARPIEALSDASRRFGAGELGHRVALSHRRHGRLGDEVQELARAWNEMADRIERLVRGQRELLANVSHELRSPLARIRVALELLPGNEARKRALEADVVELDELIDDVLTASRLEMATFPARLADVDGDALLAELVERAQNDAFLGDKQVSLQGSLGTIRADATLLKRALWNLLENAAHHGAPPISVIAEPGRITVADAGPGIPDDERERATEPFYRGDPARTPGQGVGLGLTIARRVAEIHGGRLDIAGARFSITLPPFTSS